MRDTDAAMDDFYAVMGEFYTNDQKRHESPTMRLIAQKNSTSEHKILLSQHATRTQSYGLHYTTSPGKTYVIEPSGGELNYDLVYKSPLKFYD